MGTICLQCGDKGSTNAFVYCVKCLNYAVHRYCLDVIPETLDEFVHWLCDDCDEVRNKPVIRFAIRSEPNNFILSEDVKGTKDHIVPENGNGFCGNGIKKIDLTVVGEADHVKQDIVDLVDCHKSDEELITQVVDRKVDNRDRLVRQTRLSKVVLKTIHKKKRSRTKPAKKKDEHILDDNNTSCEKENKEGLQMACDKAKRNKGSKQKRTSVKSSKKNKRKTVISCKENILENKPLVSGNRRAEEKTRLECDTNLPYNVKEDNKGSERRGKKRSKKKKRKAGENSLNSDEKMYSPSKKAHTGDGEVEDRDNNASPSCVDVEHNIYEDFPKDMHISSAEPVAMPIWRGSFGISNEKRGTIVGLMAHVSVLACHKVYDEALLFEPVLHFEMLPTSDVWPKSFQTSEPRGDNIGLYFFPSKNSEQDFDRLVDDMMRKELALKAIVQNAELLIFNSSELPLLYWKFQGKYYLWGVFRQKQSGTPSDSHPKVESPIKRTTDKTSVLIDGLSSSSPRSPLSNSASPSCNS